MQSGSTSAQARLITSPTDKRQYQYLVLSNGLRCILVHDQATRQSSAALAVAAGHFQDPDNAQGLAHFLEHMLFLGTEGYPQATDYQDFIAAHGGNHNAWTGTEYSNYYFSIASEHFAPALDRFTRFFYQPLFAEQWVRHELQAIESEFRLKQRDELRRLYQVHKATANPLHPFSKFSVGNLATLKTGSTAALRDQLMAFFQTWYRPDRMTLVLAGPQPLTELQQLAEHYGATIPARSGPEFSVDQALYRHDQMGVLIQVKPLKAARRLIMAFALPGIDADYPHKTTSFIAHLLGYEGPGSLYSHLHQQHWIHSLAAGGGISGSNFKDFNINMQLTELGLQHIDDIVSSVFAFIALIRQQGLQDWRYRERQISIENAFSFQEPARSEDLAPQLAINMHHYSHDDVIYGDYRMDSLNHRLAQQLLDSMTPERLRITLIHRGVYTNRREPIYGAEYSLQPLTAVQRTRYTDAQPSATMQLPLANPFLHQQSTVKLLPTEHSAQPQLLVSSSNQQLWWLQDPDFRAPKAHIYLHLLLPHAVQHASNYACARLWCDLLLDQLNEQYYDAEIAGLHFNLYTQQTGITLHLSGYSNGIVDLFKRLLLELPQLSMQDTRWHDMRSKLSANWQSSLASKPISLLFARVNVMLQPYTFCLPELAQAIEQLQVADFTQWQQQLFSCVSAKTLVHGDLSEADAQQIGHAVEHFIGHPCTQPQLDLTPRSIATMSGHIPTLLTTQHSDHATMLVLQHPESSIAAQAAVLLLNDLIAPRIFSQLRTEQQLGYVVGSSYLPIQQQPQLLLYVQSNNYSHDQLEQRLSDFVNDFGKQLQTLLAQQLASSKLSIQQQLREPDTNLRIRSQRLWTSIMQSDQDFDRLTALATAIESWNPESLLVFWQQWRALAHAQVFVHAVPKSFDSGS
ncbi:insulinase family protein [Pseudidiomarina mangrovi]|uniref:insulinase family protein n=1 Tax=Pseudidiomarina mangrovi TaxID=2487133 RepID=UPI000FCBE29C|nr:insulinase family protein [Pseudidiomarina mangrovi]